MTLLTLTTNLKCGSCLSKVGPALDAEPSVTSWKAELSDPRKLVHLELDSEAATEHALKLFQQAGFEAKVLPASTTEPSLPEQGFSLTPYKPLFLVVTYVVVCTLMFELQDGQWNSMTAMSRFMGFFFLGFAFFKLLDIGKFADAFATYDIVARRSRAYGLAYPWLELTLGLLFVTQTWPLLSNGATAVIMAVGLVGVVSAVRSGRKIQCACLGTAFNLPMSSVTIIENSVMLFMALAMLARLWVT